jgi:hypothetical protein
METGGIVEVLLRTFLTSVLNGSEWSLMSQPLYFLGKEHYYSLDDKFGGPQSGSLCCWERNVWFLRHPVTILAAMAQRFRGGLIVLRCDCAVSRSTRLHDFMYQKAVVCSTLDLATLRWISDNELVWVWEEVALWCGIHQAVWLRAVLPISIREHDLTLKTIFIVLNKILMMLKDQTIKDHYKY